MTSSCSRRSTGSAAARGPRRANVAATEGRSRGRPERRTVMPCPPAPRRSAASARHQQRSGDWSFGHRLNRPSLPAARLDLSAADIRCDDFGPPAGSASRGQPPTGDRGRVMEFVNSRSGAVDAGAGDEIRTRDPYLGKTTGPARAISNSDDRQLGSCPLHSQFRDPAAPPRVAHLRSDRHPGRRARCRRPPHRPMGPCIWRVTVLAPTDGLTRPTMKAANEAPTIPVPGDGSPSSVHCPTWTRLIGTLKRGESRT